MNECLPQEPGGSQRTAEAFDLAFREAADLPALSDAARRVLVAAATLFHENGAAATSVRDIAASCGLTPGALYRHFSSKDDVLYTVVSHGHDSLDARLAAAAGDAADDPTDRLRAYVRAYVTGHLVRPELAKVSRREYVHLTTERRAEITRRRRATREQLVRLLRDGARQGAFALLGGRAGPTRTATMVLDMCSRTSEWYDPARVRAERPERLAERYVDAALRLAGAHAG